MQKVNIFEAKTNLSRLVEEIETGKEKVILIARNGKPVAKLVPISSSVKQVGTLKGLTIPEDIDLDNDHILQLFEGKFT